MAGRDPATGVLMRLRRSESGNTIAIVAAGLIPLAGMIGGALDISRAYLVRTRLTQACDAGVLAGRKLMGSGGTVTSAVTTEVQKFVNFNFPPGYMGTPTLAVAPTLGANDQIVLTLTTTVPTAVMGLFGKHNLSVSTSCNARNDYANIDILLVLDTTGSMACKPERTASDCSDWINDNNKSGKTTTIGGRTVTYVEEETASSVNVSRMQGLRTALTTLQTQMATIEADFNTAAAGSRKRVRWGIVPFSQMVNAGWSQGTAGTTLYARQPTWFNTTANYKEVTVSCGRRSCSYDTTDRNNVAHNATWMTNTWDGCVEERQTSNTITPSSGHAIPGTLPSTAHDLFFDTTPSSTGTRWTVADPSQVGDSQYACPKAMRELQTLDATTFNNYFNASTGFLANGGTYLDIGLLWAARLFSRTGLWSSDNPTTFNGFAVSRYVILMTDGQMDTGSTGYGAYAQEAWWERITNDGDADTSNANHSQRMQMTCSAIKNMDIKIFVVSFGAGSTLNADMTGCSSGTGYAQKADSSTGLAQVFANIGQNIGSLRLSQ